MTKQVESSENFDINDYKAESGNAIRLFLLRHGNTFDAGQPVVQVGAKTDLPLTKKGVEQAEQMGNYFINHEIEFAGIYSGPLQRQRQTASIITEMLDYQQPTYDNETALCEIDYGKWEGLTAGEIGVRWDEAQRAWVEEGIWADDVFNGSDESVLDGLGAWIAKLRNYYSAGESVLAVSSNGIIRYFLSFVERCWEDAVKSRGLEDYKVKTGNFCELWIGDNGIEIRSWNKAPH